MSAACLMRTAFVSLVLVAGLCAGTAPASVTVPKPGAGLPGLMASELARLKARAAKPIDAAAFKAALSPHTASKGVNPTGFMFRLDDIDCLGGNAFTGPPAAGRDLAAPTSDLTDALASIVSFDRELRKVGARLIVIPVPGQATIYGPNLLTPPAARDIDPWPAYTAGMIRLLEMDVDVIDLVDDYRAAGTGSGAALHEFDHHWTSRGMELAAQRLAPHLATVPELAALAPQAAKASVGTQTVKTPAYMQVHNGLIKRGGTPKGNVPPLYTATAITLGGAAIPVDKKANVLLLGDSMLGHLEQQNGAFHAHIYRASGVPCNREWQKAGTMNMPQIYLSKYARGPHPKVVVWVIYSTAFKPGYYSGQWPRITLQGSGAPIAPPGPVASGPITAEVVISKASRISAPNQYDEAIAVYEATVRKIVKGTWTAKTVIIVRQVIDKRTLLPAAATKVGDVLTVELQPFEAAAAKDPDLETMQRFDDLLVTSQHWLVTSAKP